MKFLLSNKSTTSWFNWLIIMCCKCRTHCATICVERAWRFFFSNSPLMSYTLSWPLQVT